MPRPTLTPLFPPTRYELIIDVSFECDNCGEDTPAREGKRALLDGPLGTVTVDVCPTCYQDGIDDGILAALPTT